MKTGPYLGKYRGVVRNNVDPDQRGRIQVQVADVAGFNESSWAMPCLPVAGANMGMFTVPPKDAGVWIEFEHGNAELPIWVGGYWGRKEETPRLAQGLSPFLGGITLQTTDGNGIVISDGNDGGIRICHASGATITVGSDGIIIDNGRGATITMTNGNRIDVNGDALTIT